MDSATEQTSVLTSPRFGRRMLSWEVDEYPHHERSRTWYIISGVLGVLLIVYAIVTANFLFAVIILMAGIITFLSTLHPPEKIEVILTTTGIVLGNSFHEYPEVKNFSIVYNPPEVKYLYVDFHKPWHPLTSVPLEDIDPNQVREILLSFCRENLDRTEESLTDVVRRLYKL